MDSTKITMTTAQSALPYAGDVVTSRCAHAFRAPVAVPAVRGTAVSASVRERSELAGGKAIGHATGDAWGNPNRRIDGAFPGTRAWRPPSC
ncbi:hypothetical protein [Nocardioides sp. zg-DK7169]|uniref:hypothetical protein n=1 Tax=Nocardioides sp. zg-DK7169 TaxID=2736600 RepID=UPI0015517804|nr:hypothetical protein [Nocardioides sp. zg-DK7169]NPC96007.1 hypothetical protein [Nocardioides sp. zg-DK7169]